MINILLLGKNGQLGWELERSLQLLGNITALDYPQIDLADSRSIRNVIRDCDPQIIFNATAYTAVDSAESQMHLAEAINGIGPGILAEEARRIGALLFHYSTDYVFDGTSRAPYKESDDPNPLNVYGLTKLHGEQSVQQAGGLYFIFRTSWVYSLRRDNFVTKVMGWANKHNDLKIVDDQISSPTWARMLAEFSAQVIAQGREKPLEFLGDKVGLYHLSGAGYCSRYQWVEEMMRQTGKLGQVNLKPAKSDDFPNPAKRPQFSVLDCSLIQETFHFAIPDWRSSLGLALS